MSEEIEAIEWLKKQILVRTDKKGKIFIMSDILLRLYERQQNKLLQYEDRIKQRDYTIEIYDKEINNLKAIEKEHKKLNGKLRKENTELVNQNLELIGKIADLEMKVKFQEEDIDTYRNEIMEMVSKEKILEILNNPLNNMSIFTRIKFDTLLKGRKQ